MKKLFLLHTRMLPISEQLKIEEFLLHKETNNYCLINEGTPPSIVLGISGVFEELVNLSLLERKPLPVIRRFSGGGTILADESTLFVSFIFSKDTFPFVPFPENILKWSFSLYENIFQNPSFLLQEQDYVIENRKCGGNAQYIKKNRWLHHTSFLWNFQKELMDYLSLPSKRPHYRQDRSHEEFLFRLSSLFNQTEWISRLKMHLQTQFDLKELFLEEFSSKFF